MSPRWREESSPDPRKQKAQEESSCKGYNVVNSCPPSDKLRRRIPIFVAVLALILRLWRISFYLSPLLRPPFFSPSELSRHFARPNKGGILKRPFLVGRLFTKETLHFAGYESV